MSKKDWWKYGYYGYGYGRSISEVKVDDFSEDKEDDEDLGKPWKRYRSSLGWGRSKLLDTTSYYTSYSYHSGDELEKTKELLSKAYRATRDMVVILDFPFNIYIDFGLPSVSSGVESSGRRIFLPTDIMDASGYTDTEKVNIMCGLGIHEAAHLKYTQVEVLNGMLGRLSKSDSIAIAGCGEIKITSSVVDFIKSMINLVEDERVENLLLQERPGYAEFIDKEKFYQYKKFVEAEKVKAADANDFLNNLFRLIRFPENIDGSVIEKYSDTYTEIKDLLYPLPETTKESCIIGFKIYQKTLELFGKLDIPEKEQKKIFAASGVSGLSAFNEVLYGYDSDPKNAVSDERISGKLKANPLPAQLIQGLVERGVEKKSFFEKVKGSKNTYLTRVSKIKKYVPGIRKLIKGHDKNYTFNIHGCRSGLLDTNKLAEAYQGVPQVYVRQGKVTTNKTTVAVLVDESGSMGCNKKWEIARDAAILLNESLSGIPGVDLYIYGHTADTTFSGSTNIIIYKEGKSTPESNYSLSSIRARFENRDGVAITEVHKRIRKFTSSPVLLFVISDGAPAAHGYYGSAARDDVKKRVEEVERDGFTVVQVTIDNVHGSKDMFRNVVDLKNDLSDFPKLLSGVIKKAIVNDKKTTVS